MTWSKLSDDFTDDCWTLSDAAFRLHVEGITWSNRKLLDLRIPKDDLPRFAKHPDVVEELAAVGWWTDEGEHYEIRHHALYQRSRADVLHQQEANLANGRRGGRPAGVVREVDRPSLTHSVSESVSEWVTEPIRERSGRPTAPRAAHRPDPARGAVGHASVTHSVSESLTQSLTERDRTGQDRLFGGKSSSAEQPNETSANLAVGSPLPSLPSSSSSPSCSACGLDLGEPWVATGHHPGCHAVTL
jgi:hypothetical protein